MNILENLNFTYFLNKLQSLFGKNKITDDITVYRNIDLIDSDEKILLTSVKPEMYIRLELDKVFALNKRQFYYIFYRSIANINSRRKMFPSLLQTIYSYAFSLTKYNQKLNINCARFNIMLKENVKDLTIKTEGGRYMIYSDFVLYPMHGAENKKRMASEKLSQIYYAMEKCSIIAINLSIEIEKVDRANEWHSNFIILKKDKTNWLLHPYEPHGTNKSLGVVEIFINQLVTYCKNPEQYVIDLSEQKTDFDSRKKSYIIDYNYIDYKASCPNRGIQTKAGDQIGFCTAYSSLMFFLFVMQIILNDDFFTKNNIKYYINMIEKNVLNTKDQNKLTDLTFNFMEQVCKYYFNNIIKKSYKNFRLFNGLLRYTFKEYVSSHINTGNHAKFLDFYGTPKKIENYRKVSESNSLQDIYEFCTENIDCESGICKNNYCNESDNIPETVENETLPFNEWFNRGSSNYF